MFPAFRGASTPYPWIFGGAESFQSGDCTTRLVQCLHLNPMSSSTRPMAALSSKDDFRSHALDYWQEVSGGASRRATAHSAALEAIVDQWRAAGTHTEKLRSLLADPAAEVRYAAAASLGGTVLTAVEELRRLADDSTGRIAPTARLLLAQWHRNSEL